MAPPTRKKLGEVLVEAGIIDEQQLRYALAHQRQWGGKLGQALVDLKLASEPQIVFALSQKLGYEIVRLDAIRSSAALEAALKLVPREVARRHGVLPIAVDTSTLSVAMSDPTNIAVTDEISFRAGRRVKIAIAGDREVARAVTRLYFPEESPDPQRRALELDTSSTEPLNRTHELLPEHLQERFFPTSLRALEAQPPLLEPLSEAAPVPASGFAGAPPAAIAPPPEQEASSVGDSGSAGEAGRASTASSAAPSQATLEAALRDALDRMATGEEPTGSLRPARLVAALANAMLRRGLVTEAELVLELMQGRR